MNQEYTTYANVTRTYNSKRTVYEAAQELQSITVRTDLLYGKQHGFWNGSPILEIESEPGTVTPEIAALTEPIDRHIDEHDAISQLYYLIMESIEKSWQPDAFHLVFHSSGWDSRMISGVIKKLLKDNGPEWLGTGLLFLSNRWEADEFIAIMGAMGWPSSQYAVYREGSPFEHFAQHAYDMWRCGPCPRPGNMFWYLPAWAEKRGQMPGENVQAYTGLWANEVWHAFFPGPINWWQRRVRKSFGIHMLASMPLKAQWTEYPLVSLPILETLRRTKREGLTGNTLRQAVGMLACPEANHIQAIRSSDGSRPLSGRLRKELDTHYKETAFGKHQEWWVPPHSSNATDWGRWSTALLVDKLIAEGKSCEWV